jgi:hypothetical protein
VCLLATRVRIRSPLDIIILHQERERRRGVDQAKAEVNSLRSYE